MTFSYSENKAKLDWSRLCFFAHTGYKRDEYVVKDADIIVRVGEIFHYKLAADLCTLCLFSVLLCTRSVQTHLFTFSLSQLS